MVLAIIYWVMILKKPFYEMFFKRICRWCSLYDIPILWQAIRLRAGMALTIFAFNNTPQQYAIREAGGIKYSVFEPFLNSSIEYDVCYAAFQVTFLTTSYLLYIFNITNNFLIININN